MHAFLLYFHAKFSWRENYLKVHLNIACELLRKMSQQKK